MDDGLPERLYFLRRLEYNNQKGDKNDGSSGKKTEPKMDETIWEKMREVWSIWLSESTSSENGEKEDNHIMCSMPRERTPKEWNSESETAQKLRYLWKKFYALSFQEAQKLFPEMLEQNFHI